MKSPPASASRRADLAFSRIIGGVVAFVGFLALAGWAFGSQSLTSIIPGAVTMKPDAALAFILSGSVLLLLPPPSPQTRFAACACALTVGGIALLTLIEYASGWNAGVDQLLFRDPVTPLHPGRMAPNTALCFVLVAAALLLTSQPAGDARRHVILGWLGALVVGIGFFAITDQLADLTNRQGWWGLTKMAIPAAVLFLLLGAAVLRFAWQGSGMRWLISPWRTTALGGGLALLVAVAAFSMRSAVNLATSTATMKHTHEAFAKMLDQQSHVGKSRNAANDELMAAVEKQLLVWREAQSGALSAWAFTIVPSGLLLSLLLIGSSVLRLNGEIASRRRGASLLTWEKRALELIVSEAPLREVLDGLMLGLENQLPEALVSVLLLDDDGVHLRHGAAPSLPEAYDRAIDGITIGPAVGSCGTAVYTDHQVIASDIATDPRWTAYRELALAHGLHACWSTPIHGCHGEILGTLVVYYHEPRRPALAELEVIERAVNITRIAIERKRAEEEIRKLNAGLEQRVEKRTRELLAANATLADFKAALDEHAIVAITDASGKITYANDKFCAISKYPHEELLGQDHRILNSGHHPKSFFQELWQTVASGRVWKGEVKNHAKDGSAYWVMSTIVPFLGYAGRPAQFVAIRTDITERKRAEDALRDSSERLRLATDAADIAVWDRDLKSEVLTWDEQMFAIYGLPPTPDGRVSHEDWQAAVLPADLAAQEARLRHTIAAGGRDRREFRIVRASDQAVRVIQAAETVVAGADGQAARVVGINLDITERKQAEEEIRKLNAALLGRATELEAANKELEAFSYSVSHDLRAPLRAVDGFSRMVLEDYAPRLDANGQRLLGVVRSEAQRMSQLIDDLLAFSRLGRQPLEPTPIDMQVLAQEVFDELSAQELERTLRLDLHSLPPAWGTQPLVRQAWVNLIGNAIKFTKEREVGEIEIGARKGQGEGEGEGQVYYVKDNGAGFDMHSAGKLFGVFQRLHTQQEFAGTGVGLALVQRIVKRHGGRVWPEAEVNRGATFYFTLSNQTP